ncbi:kinase [Flagelloscypha sp. PMI_526]|nr:kinase [Flagelloscypha sp. PMI_526]
MRPRLHQSQLYSHQEEGPEDAWDSYTQSSPLVGTSSSGSRSRHSARFAPARTYSGLAHLQTSPPPPVRRESDLYSQYLLRYRSSDHGEANTDDPDMHYLNRQDQLQDTGDSDDEDPHRFSSDPLLLDADLSPPATEKDRDRLEWHAMLASVLAGDVLKSEKTRIANVMDSGGDQKSQIRQSIWVGIRARFSGRSPDDELKKLAERRLRVVDPVIEQVLAFRVSDPTDGERHPDVAVREVGLLLHRLDVAHSLYPNWNKLIADKPRAGTAAFLLRLETLNTWSNVMITLEKTIQFLRRWTGSETLDVSAHNTSAEVPISLSTDNTAGPEVADPSSFIERLLKEETMQRTFEKGALWTIHNFLNILRTSQINLFSSFKEMNLPTFENELLPILAFPTRLAQAALRVRIHYATRLVPKSDNIIIDQTLDDLKLNLGLACMLKRQYEDFLTPDPEGRWDVPPCLEGDYDETILEGLTCLFSVISAKLRNGKKAIYFKETDLLESHWATFNDITLTVNGGSKVVAEHLSSIINRLMVRVTNYFDSQIRIPTDDRNSEATSEMVINPSGDLTNPRKMTDDQMVTWYGRVLESVRLRYRKLQRFARALTQRFGNSAEYSIENMDLEQLMECLRSTGHFLVYTHPLPTDSVQFESSFEEEGLYLVASPSLWDRSSEYITSMLTEAFRVDDGVGDSIRVTSTPDFGALKGDLDEPEYILIFSPSTPWVWHGRMKRVPMEPIELDMKENHIRLITNGLGRQLASAKEMFRSAFYNVSIGLDEEGGEVEELIPIIDPPNCLVEQQAHLPTVNSQLRKIARSTNKLAESIADSVHHVRSSLRTSPGSQELLENWYTFASEHGNHAHKYMDRSTINRFSRLLIKLAISWVSFICDDCDPNDRKTFKWAVNALEFTSHRTKRNLLHLPDEQFEMLRQKVSNCMTLLISHFDILGARGAVEANKEKEREEEQMRARVSKHEALEDEEYTGQIDDIMAYTDSSTRLFWDRLHRSVQGLESERVDVGLDNNVIGRVLDNEKPEDRSLVFLANTSSNVSIRWQQGRFIGSGAFGSVYMAVNLDTGSIMAVKEGVPNLYSQIKDELRVMEMLHHPNVVEYYGIEVHRDKVYIFEEYCQGGSLAALLEHGRIEDERIIQVYTMQMLEGLAYLHSQGVVHRDIKPDNILLDGMGVLKFVDFGAAKIFARNTRTMHKSRRIEPMVMPSAPLQDPALGLPGKQNSLTGTPMYMSPEVIKNDNHGRFGAMDVWSLGCVVLEFATGKKPWSNLDNEWAIMFHIGVATQHPPLPEPGQLSTIGIDFIRACLCISAYDRPSAVELMDHPWMIDFKEALRSLEELEGVQDDSGFVANETFEHASVARQAAIQQEFLDKQMGPDSESTSGTSTPADEYEDAEAEFEEEDEYGEKV